MLKIFEKIGNTIFSWLRTVGEFNRLTLETLYWVFLFPWHKRPVKRQPVFEQMVYMGVSSVVIVFFVTFFTGVVIAMQAAHQLSKMGGTIYVASLTSVSLCRELGPVLTALVIAGRIGAAITAEIGSMQVNEQIEALDTMAINPVRFLIAPKLISLLVMLPCLTILGDAFGMLGGYIVGVYSLNINSHLFIQTAFKYLTLKDIYTGLSKSIVFAAIIVLVGAYHGLKTRGGAVGVGRSTTLSVVTSFILIIFADCVITSIYYFSKM